MVVRFSVVIPCCNEADYIADTIKSLRAQTFRGGYEIVVVDNNCTDDTAEIARRLGARVVAEVRQGVCPARQRGTEASRGDIVVSADADTLYPARWLDTIDESFRVDGRVVAVAGPCRYRRGPLWGRVYGRLLFGAIDLIYRLTGRLCYATATNLAFWRDRWPGYDIRLTQGGDELDLLRRLRRIGAVKYDHGNAVWTSSRRLSRGILYNIAVTLVVYYLSAYLVNRLFGRRVIGSAPLCRNDRGRRTARVRLVAVSVLVTCGLLMMFTGFGHVVTTASRSVIDEFSVLLDPDEGG